MTSNVTDFVLFKYKKSSLIEEIQKRTVVCLSTLFPVGTGGGFFFAAESGFPFCPFFPASTPAAASAAASLSASLIISLLSAKPH